MMKKISLILFLFGTLVCKGQLQIDSPFDHDEMKELILNYKEKRFKEVKFIYIWDTSDKNPELKSDITALDTLSVFFVNDSTFIETFRSASFSNHYEFIFRNKEILPQTGYDNTGNIERYFYVSKDSANVNYLYRYKIVANDTIPDNIKSTVKDSKNRVILELFVDKKTGEPSFKTEIFYLKRNKIRRVEYYYKNKKWEIIEDTKTITKKNKFRDLEEIRTVYIHKNDNSHEYNWKMITIINYNNEKLITKMTKYDAKAISPFRDRHYLIPISHQ